MIIIYFNRILCTHNIDVIATAAWAINKLKTHRNRHSIIRFSSSGSTLSVDVNFFHNTYAFWVQHEFLEAIITKRQTMSNQSFVSVFCEGEKRWSDNAELTSDTMRSNEWIENAKKKTWRCKRVTRTHIQWNEHNRVSIERNKRPNNGWRRMADDYRQRRPYLLYAISKLNYKCGSHDWYSATDFVDILSLSVLTLPRSNANVKCANICLKDE